MLQKKYFPLIIALLLLGEYMAFFSGFFPNENGGVGHDYARGLAMHLDSYYWFTVNGFLEIPWFTPSFCGGVMNYASFQSSFYSVPMLLSLFFDPMSAEMLTYFLYAGFGLAGFYFLLRKRFDSSPSVALLAGGTFLFNSFYSTHMIVGHFGYFSYTLIPFLCLLFMPPRELESKTRIIFKIVVGGIIFASMVHSSYGVLLIPTTVCLTILGIIHGFHSGKMFPFFLRLSLAGLWGILLSISKLIAVFTLMGNFSRDSYSLPGADGIGNMLLLLQSLFMRPDYAAFTGLFTNTQWGIGPHELEFSVTVVPFLILAAYIGKLLIQKNFNPLKSVIFGKNTFCFGILLLFLAVPLLLNLYTPTWNMVLKEILLIKNSSWNLRWFSIYIPVIVLLSALAFEKLFKDENTKWGVSLVGLVVIVVLQISPDWTFYHQQPYSPLAVAKGYQEVKEGIKQPKINSIAAYRTPEGEFLQPVHRNDTFIRGGSQLLCSEDLFGYRLEAFPIKTLQPGNITMETNGVLNMKNPACYIWGKENNCKPGDHFRVDQKEEMLKLASYRPFEFVMPTKQIIANWVNLFGLIFTFIIITGYGILVLKGREEV